jgi:serine/threonine protein kinase
MLCCLEYKKRWSDRRTNDTESASDIFAHMNYKSSKLKCNEYKIGSYKCRERIGQGSFSMVIGAVEQDSGQKVAIKIIDLQKFRENELCLSFQHHRLPENHGKFTVGFLDLVKELRLQLQVQHENILELIEIIQNERYQFAVMPFAENGNLLDWIEYKRHGSLSESEACFYFKQLIAALSACHAQGVYHRDVKLENILIMDQGGLKLKLTDFGLGSSYLSSKASSSLIAASRSLSKQETSQMRTDAEFCCKTCCGTPLYASPEVLHGRNYAGGPVDIWSAGVVLYMMILGEPPFKSQRLEQLYDLIKKGQYTPIFGRISNGIFIQYML